MKNNADNPADDDRFGKSGDNGHGGHLRRQHLCKKGHHKTSRHNQGGPHFDPSQGCQSDPFVCLEVAHPVSPSMAFDVGYILPKGQVVRDAAVQQNGLGLGAF